MQSKEINYRDGLLRFAVPSSWIEEYEEDGSGVFYEDVEGSGTLRLDVVTLESPEQPSWESLTALLADVAEVEPHQCAPVSGDAFLAKSVEDTEDDGERVRLHSWYVASPLPPGHVRLALFSYTISLERAEDKQTETELAFLDEALSRVQFSPTLGTDEAVEG